MNLSLDKKNKNRNVLNVDFWCWMW